MSSSRVSFVTGTVVAFLASSVACGARTGLLATGVVNDETEDAGTTVLRLDAAVRDAAETTAVACVPGQLELTMATPTVLFAIDRSQSMSGRLARGSATRWNALRQALGEALPAVDERIQLGSLIFPGASGGRSSPSCDVTASPVLTPALGNAEALLQALDAQGPGGATPTADALRLAQATLASVRAASKARAIVLATDGGPDCNAYLDTGTCDCLQGNGCNEATRCLDDVRTVTVIADIAAQGIPTYVVGLLGSGNDQRFDDVLDRMAIAGGRARTGATAYYPATDEAELSAAFVAIRDQVGACIYLTRSVPDGSGSIEVTLDGAALPFDSTGATGWSWADRPNGEILFAADACSRATTATTLDAVVACGDAG